MIKTLKQIKQEVAKEYEFDSYEEMIDYEEGFDICIIDEIANRHATQQLILHGVVVSFVCEHKYKDNVCDKRGVRKCLNCYKLEEAN